MNQELSWFSKKSDPGTDHNRGITGFFFPDVIASAFMAPFTLHSVISPSH